MNTSKLTPLVLLIPAVVLAQPAPLQNQPVMPQSSLMQNAPVKPSNPADALNAAKKQAKELKAKLPSNGEVGSGYDTNSCSTTGEECYYTGGNG